MTTIYLIRDFGGPDCWPDLYVEAEFPEQAISMWRHHYRLTHGGVWPEKVFRIPDRCGLPRVMVWSPRDGDISLAWEASPDYKQLRELSQTSKGKAE